MASRSSFEKLLEELTWGVKAFITSDDEEEGEE